MLDVEQAIREVGAVYRAFTGRPIEVGISDLPSEIDPMIHVEDRYHQLKAMLASQRKDARAAGGATAWAPAMDVIELELAVRCELDLPAVARDQVTVSLIGDCLIVRGQRTRGEKAVFTERPEGPFQRVIALPPRARRDGIESTLKDGVLSITIPIDGAASHLTPIGVK